MTRSEERLMDALWAAAAVVREDELRPLTVTVTARRRWAIRLAPAAAAAGAAVAVCIALVLTSLVGSPPQRTPAARNNGYPAVHLGWVPAAVTPGRAAVLPRSYAVVEQAKWIRIRDTATQHVTATLPYPPSAPAALQPVDVAAGSGGTFVAAYDRGEQGPNAARLTRLYSFRITGAGQVTRLSGVRGGVLAGVTEGGVAVSPDGSRLAVVGYDTTGHSTGKGSTPELAMIIVIDLRTGTRQIWQGGLQRPGFSFAIPSISWAPDGRWLVFLGEWCQVTGQGGMCGSHDAQVRTLSLAAGGGPLSGGSVLLSESPQTPLITQALLTPGGGSITAVILGPPFLGFARTPQDLRIIQVPLAGGQARLLYHGQLGNRVSVSLSCDRTGRYWLLAGHRNGWIGSGRLHVLKPGGGYASTDAWW